MKITVRFPFAVTQTTQDTIEVDMAAQGVGLPWLSPDTGTAEEFDKRCGIDLSMHEDIIEKLNTRYHADLIRAAMKVEVKHTIQSIA